MKIKDLFDIKYGVNLELSNCEITNDTGSINFVARTSNNNGVVAKVKLIDGIAPQPAGVLSCAGGGSVLATFVQYKPFYSGRDLYILTPKKEMPLIEKLYYCYLIRMNKYRYSYGRQANKTLKDIEIPDTIPDWVYNIDLNKYNRMIQTSVVKKHIPLNTHTWQPFKVSDLFDVTGTKTTKVSILKEIGTGKYPYVTTKATNNGVDGYYDFYTETGNVLTIDSAVVGYCAYQKQNFSASDHVEKLIPKFKINPYNALFLVTLFNQEHYRYSYGRKCNQIKIRNTILKLPATPTNTPDWAFMEEYIKSLPHSDKI